ncbi:MAG: gamma-glutamyltransferase family protein [Myxococcales bacterium]|nr:gamma-glutamyltransferase family protein [Myxococcales bacterium]
MRAAIWSLPLTGVALLALWLWRGFDGPAQEPRPAGGEGETAAAAGAGPRAGAVVSAATPAAAAAGVEILRAGGNAIDAAVATAFSLFVTEPAGSGLGGQSSFIVQRPGQEPFVINGTSFAPAATNPDSPAEALSGARASTVPNAVRTLDFAHRRFGSGKLGWATLLAPAIRQAEHGVELGRFRRTALVKYGVQLSEDPTAAAIFLGPAAQVPALGGLTRQPLLAKTLRRLAEAGAMEFYRGAMAKDIARDMRERDGWIDEADLAAVAEPQVVAPVSGSYRGFSVHSLPPPAGGWVVLQMLALLERADATRMAEDHPDRRLLLAEALRTGHAERAARPIEDLTAYQLHVKERLNPARLQALSAAWAERADRGGEGRGEGNGDGNGDGNGETTHFSVVDASGTAVGVTQSLNAYFGARVAHPRLGFLYNDYMHEFRIGEKDHPFALAPGAMPYSSMSATLLSRGKKPVLVLGSPGSARIISAVVQVASHWVDAGGDIERAVAAPRLHVRQGVLKTETLLGPELSARLAHRGLAPELEESDFQHQGRDAYFGGVHAIALQNGRWVGAADPRRDGRALRAVATAAPEPAEP